MSAEAVPSTSGRKEEYGTNWTAWFIPENGKTQPVENAGHVRRVTNNGSTNKRAGRQQRQFRVCPVRLRQGPVTGMRWSSRAQARVFNAIYFPPTGNKISSRRLSQQLIFESLLLAALATLVGLPLALWLENVLIYFVPPTGVPVSFNVHC